MQDTDPAAPPDPLTQVLRHLGAAGLAGDTTQLLDALWLALHRPAPPPAPARTVLPEAGADSSGDAGKLGGPPAPSPAPAGRPMRIESATGRGEARIDLDPENIAGAQAIGVFGRAGAVAAPTDTDSQRARPTRVAGVAALRDAGALANALRPLGKRRDSSTRFELDEVSTIEHCAETGVLVARLAPQRERFFAATLLIEDTPALPLWRALATELEALLARRGGFRSFRRFTLGVDRGELLLRSRSGARHDRRVLNDADDSLVLLATDGTTEAWSDGRMAALLRALGRHSSVAVLQWMPRERWPHTALGAADTSARLPRAGAPNRELRWQRPRWLGRDEKVIPIPLLDLKPASFASLAAALMAKPGAKVAAGLVWADAPGPTPLDGDEESRAPLSPAQRVARFEGLASPRLLQAAIQLSAAAPLNLPIVRLVHRALQPDAPAEDLPLLLLGGLLETLSDPAASKPARDSSDDSELRYDFAPGVRELLQRSLSRGDAEAVRRTVSAYIAERSGSTVDFGALLLDPQGPFALPAWARPFAEVTRQVHGLFASSRGSEPPLREPLWAPGVTLQVSAMVPRPVLQMAWSPDGTRLAALHASGLQVFRLEETGPGRRRLVREPLALRAPVRMMFVIGFDIPDPTVQAFIGRMRKGWPEFFRGALEPAYHTVVDTYPDRTPTPDIARLLTAVRKTSAVLCCIGSQRFHESAWMRELLWQWTQGREYRAGQQIWCLRAGLNASATGTWRWKIETRPPLLARPIADDSVDRTPGLDRRELVGDAAACASVLLALLQDSFGRGFPDAPAGGGNLWAALQSENAVDGDWPPVAFGRQASSIAWDHRGRLLVADGRQRSVVLESTLAMHTRYAALGKLSIRATDRPLLAAHPTRHAIAVAVAEELVLVDAEAPLRTWTSPAPIEQLTWAPDGARLGLRLAGGASQILSIEPRALRGRPGNPSAISAGIAWTHDDARPTSVSERGAFRLGDSASDWLRMPGPRVGMLAWSRDDRWLAAGALGGRILLLDREQARLATSFDLPESDVGLPTRLGFVPRPLDRGFDNLAVAHGPAISLLRLDPRRFGDIDTPSVAPTRATPQPWASPNEVVDAACEVLRALGILFHVGGLVADKGFARQAYPPRLLRDSADPNGPLLDHVASGTEGAFTSAVRQALNTHLDPLAHADRQRGREEWLRQCEEARSVAGELSAMTSTATSPNERLVERLQGAIQSIATTIRTLGLTQKQALDLRFGGSVSFALYPVSLLVANWNSHAGDALSTLEDLPATLERLQGAEVLDIVESEAGRLAWLGPAACMTPLIECRRLDDYASRFVKAWEHFATELLQTDPPEGWLEVDIRTQKRSLDCIRRLFEPWSDALRIREGDEDIRDGDTVSLWSVRPGAYPTLVQSLGSILTTQLALRLGEAPLAASLAWGVPGHTLLWVDDQPEKTPASSMLWYGMVSASSPPWTPRPACAACSRNGWRRSSRT